MREIIVDVKIGETVKYRGFYIYSFEHAVDVLETEDYSTMIAEVKTVGEAIDYIDNLKLEEVRRKYYESKRK